MRKFLVGLVIKGRKDASVTRATRSAAADQGRVGQAVKKVQDRFARVREARKYGRTLNELKRKQRGLDGTSERLERGIAEVERRYRSARRAARGYSDEVDQATASTRRFGEASNGINKRDVGMAVGAAGLAVGALATRTAFADQGEVTRLGTVINAKPGEDRRGAARASFRAAKAYARRSDNIASARELVRIEYEMNSAGLEEDAARAGARISHKVAKVTSGSGEEVAKLIGTTFNNMGAQMEGDLDAKMSKIGNLLAQTQLQFQISDFNQLGAGMTEGMSSAVQYNVALEQTAALIGQLNTKGFTGSRAGTSFRGMMGRMSKAADEFGFSLARGEDGQLDMVETLSRLDASLDGLDIDERANRLREVFGEEASSGVGLLLEDVDGLRDSLSKLETEAGSDVLSRKYQDFVEEGAGLLAQFKESAQQALGGLGEGFMPVVGAALKGGTAVLNIVATVMDKVPGAKFLIGALAGGVMLLGGYLAVATTATWAWNTAMGVASSARLVGFLGRANRGLITMGRNAIPTVIAGIRALNISMLMNPVGLAVAGIAFAGLLLYKFWKPVKAFFGGLWSEVGGPLTAVGKALWSFVKYTPVGIVLRAVGKAFGMVGSALKWVAGLFKPVDDGLEEAHDAGARFGRLIKAVFSWSPLGVIGKAWNGLPSLVKRPLSAVRSAVGGAWSSVKGVLDWEPGQLLRSLWDAVTGVVTRPIDAAVGTITALWDSLKSIFSWSPTDAVRGAWGGIASVVTAPLRIAKSGASTAWAGVKSVLSWRPKGLLKGLWSGVSSVVATPLSGALSAGRGVWSRFKTVLGWSPMGALKSAWGGVKDFFGGVFDRIGSVIGRAREAFRWLRKLNPLSSEKRQKRRASRTRKSANDNAVDSEEAVKVSVGVWRRGLALLARIDAGVGRASGLVGDVLKTLRSGAQSTGQAPSRVGDAFRAENDNQAAANDAALARSVEDVVRATSTAEPIRKTTVHMAGDHYEIHVHGVTDVAGVADELEPILRRRAEARQRKALYD